ncbi:uncharacterized protein BKA55DRAFT_496923 [Fusarium redolens]|uniref:F-box domain-containing protein n=1 Tax=Fusarium redolens TaxID=48865 RepID=A0A9P9KYT5_FUSRE|nr:uncharacterized protein BKA55DRAFT_496923 [Fusarium redolens]KAH7270843.1 hypothetical protein BKA55DRAFT_496923 [Fusarium redolens]
MPSLISLPSEVLGEIGSHLYVEDLGNASLGCRVLEHSLRVHLFRGMTFTGHRTAVAEALLRFLSNRNGSRPQAMGRICRSLRIVVMPQNNDTFDEGREFLPALLMSTKKSLPGVVCLSLSLHGLSNSEITAFHRMLKEGPNWDAHSLRNASVDGLDVVPEMGQHGVAPIKEGCPSLRRLRVCFRNPLHDFPQHLNGTAQVKLNQLENIEQLIIQESAGASNAYPIGGIYRPMYIIGRLCAIADSLRDMTSLRQISMVFHPRVMTWISRPALRLIPGQGLRIELDTFLAAAIMAMGERLSHVGEICLVENNAILSGVNMIHRGVRDSDGEMAVRIESPGHENSFPLNISH